MNLPFSQGKLQGEEHKNVLKAVQEQAKVAASAAIKPILEAFSYELATLTLPHWNLRAEYWIEGAGEEYSVDTNEAGTYLRVATDQVRFYPLHATTNTARLWPKRAPWADHSDRTATIDRTFTSRIF
jgi:hypothetical protein